MDHYPYFGIYGEEDYQMLVDTFATTKELYQEYFGDWPYPDPVEAARHNRSRQLNPKDPFYKKSREQSKKSLTKETYFKQQLQ